MDGLDQFYVVGFPTADVATRRIRHRIRTTEGVASDLSSIEIPSTASNFP